MTRSAALTAWATPGRTSKVGGSVLGLLSIDVTFTYRPPTWAATFPYSFSAATTRMTASPVAAPGSGEVELQALRTGEPTTSAAAARSTWRRTGARRPGPIVGRLMALTYNGN